MTNSSLPYSPNHRILITDSILPSAKKLLLLLLIVVLSWLPEANGDSVNIYYHTCTILPEYPDCTGYTGQEFSGLIMHTTLTSSFPPGDYDIEVKHPEGGLATFYVEYQDGVFYGQDAGLGSYGADGVPLNGVRTLRPTGRVYIHNSPHTLANVYMTSSETAFLYAFVACDCGPHADLPPAVSRLTLSGTPPTPIPSADDQTKECDPNTGCSSCSKPPMATYWFHLMLASLHIEDTPISYPSPRGPSTDFKVVYNQREANQPTSFSFSNFGPKWTFGWLSYVTDNGPSSASANPTVYVRSGGTETYGGFDSGTQTYAPDKQTLAVLARISGTTYEKRFSDGSKEIFSDSDSASSYPRRVFLSSVVDPAGNTTTLTYDSSFRITAITDSLGQSTTLDYGLTGDPLKITKVTDPFSHFATFEYTSGKLTKITDPVGIQSQFSYASGSDFIESMTTPYGTTHFTKGETGDSNRWVEATDPRGGKERVEYNDYTNAIPALELSAPAGVYNDDLQRRNTFYWDKKAMADAPGDYTKAHLFHWLPTTDGKVSGIKHSDKKALESRIWYTYDGQTDPALVGTNALPIKVQRLLDGGTPQTFQYAYNSLGNLIRETDPQTTPHPRVKSYVYKSNGVDLETVYQRNPDTGVSADPSPDSQAADKIASYTYDPAEPAHKPKTITDAAGQITTYHYNPQGQVLTIVKVVNGANQTTAYAYGDGSAHHPVGYLVSITSPTFGTSSAVTRYEYDDDTHRIQTVQNDPDGYRVDYLYDDINRVTLVTYPDATTQQFSYMDDERGIILDLTASKDRLDRWTTRHYNGNRQMDSMTDPLDRTTLYDWCICGSMVGITDPNGNVTTFNRDLQSRVYSKVFADSSTITYTYEDTTSRLKSMTDALSQTTNYSYFADNTLHQVSYTNALNPTPTVSYTYDPNYNRVASMADGTGPTNYSYYTVPSSPTVGANQLYQINGPLSNDTITYTYDELGRALSQDINGTTASVVYDTLGRLYTTANALGTFTRLYESDVTPRLHSLTYPNGQTANYTYYGNTGDRRLQTLQHLTSGSVNLSQHDYSYDPEGQIQAWTKTLGMDETDLAFTYDDAQQLISLYDGSQVTDYGYDYAGNKIGDSIHVPHPHTPSGSFKYYTANNLNQLDSVSTQLKPNPASDPVAITYDADGNMTYDGGNQTFEWDAANRLIAINYVDTSTRTEFAYDGLNRRVKIIEYGPGMKALIRPTNSSFSLFTSSPLVLLAGTYTLSFEGLTPSPTDYTAFIDNIRLNGTLVPNGSFETPSVSGGIVSQPSGATWTFTTSSAGICGNGSGFDNANAPDGSQVGYLQFTAGLTQTVTVAAGTYTLTFDAAQRDSNGQRLRVTVQPYPPNTVVKNFVWCGNQICEERDGSNTVTKRFFNEGQKRIGGSDAGNYYYSRDHLGSIREVTDSTGALKAQYDYDSWGNSVVVSGNMNVDFGFTGHYFHQPSGLNLSLYRAYNPSLARWISRDPIGESGGVNLYEYVRNDPVKLIDPDGRNPLQGAIIGGEIGSFFPGPGTVIGAAVGAGVGTVLVIWAWEVAHERIQKEADAQRCREQAHEDYDRAAARCDELPCGPERDACHRQAAHDFQYDLRRCNGGWYGPNPPMNPH